MLPILPLATPLARLALRRQAAVDIEATKNALAKASHANRILLLATTTSAAAAVLAAAQAVAALTTAKVEAAAAANAAAEALDVSNESSVVAYGSASASAKAKDTQRAAICQFEIARDMVTTARDAMSGELMMWRTPAHDTITSHIHVASLLIRLIAGNSPANLSLSNCLDGSLRTVSIVNVLVHFEIVCMHPD